MDMGMGLQNPMGDDPMGANPMADAPMGDEGMDDGMMGDDSSMGSGNEKIDNITKMLSNLPDKDLDTAEKYIESLGQDNGQEDDMSNQDMMGNDTMGNDPMGSDPSMGGDPSMGDDAMGGMPQPNMGGGQMKEGFMREINNLTSPSLERKSPRKRFNKKIDKNSKVSPFSPFRSSRG